MQHLRVLLAIETFLPLVGGSERQAFLQGQYLRAQGIDASIMTMHFQQRWAVYEQLENVPVVRVGGRILAWHDRLPGVLRRLCYLCALLVFAWQLWQRRREYDILHVFQLTLFTLPALLVCRLTHKPLVIGMRNDPAPSEDALPAQKRRSGKSWANLDGLQRLGRPALLLINRLLRDTHAHILILSTQMRESLQLAGLTGAQVLLIPNGVDPVRFYPAPEQATGNTTVVCVAKMRYQKGIDILLRAWRAVVALAPEARLLLVGDGPLLTSLYQLAVELGISASVEFTGLCPDVVPQLQRGRISVLPSRWEGMPNALLEAMACGLACVATRVSGSEDLLAQEACGLLVEPGDANGLASAILRLLRNPDLARRYGQAARRSIERSYVFGEVMHRHVELYTTLVDSRSVRHVQEVIAQSTD